MDCVKCDHDEREHEGEIYRSCTAEDCDCSNLELNYTWKEGSTNG